MKTKHTLRAVLGCFALLATALPAQVPNFLSYQGRVAVGTANFNGTGQFKFALVDPGNNPSEQAEGEAERTGSFITAVNVTVPGKGYVSAPLVTITGGGGTNAAAIATVAAGVVTGITVTNAGSGYTSRPNVAIAAPPPTYYTALWSNDGTTGPLAQPAASVALQVTKGLYSVLLGDTAPPLGMAPIPASVFAQPDVRLRVWFSDNVNGFQLLTPDQRLAPNGYLPDGAVSEAKIAGGSITESKLARGAVGTLNLAPGLSLGGTTAGTFCGDGSGLTGLQAASLTGDLTFTVKGNASLQSHVSENGMGSGSAINVAVSGSYVCLANFFDGLRIIDISNPRAPALQGHIPESLMGNSRAVGIGALGEYVCLANGDDGVRIIDISDPQAPALRGHIPESLMGNGFAYGIAVVGISVYVANVSDGLRIIDISVPHTPVLRGSIPESLLGNGSAYGVAVVGSHAYLANGEGGLRIIDVFNPQAPLSQGHIPASLMGNGFAFAVAVEGSYAYLANGEDGLRIINISNPQNPILVGHVPGSLMGNATAAGIAVSGSYAYLANTSDGLRIFDISSPQAPVLTGHIPKSSMGIGNGFAYGVAISGSNAYLANANDGLRILSLLSATAGSFAGDGSGLTFGGTSLTALLASKVSKAGDTMTGSLTLATGILRMSDSDILFRGGSDPNHGVGWFGSSKLFDGVAVDGPVLYGFGGGALGSSAQKIALRWTSDGKVGIGGAPIDNKLEVYGAASKETAGAWLANSDRRIKEDIQPIGHALETLDRVRLVDFRYTEDYRAAHPGIPARRYLNVVAQEFAEVFPADVQSSGEKLPDGSAILQVDTYPLTIYSAAAVQELHTKLKQKDAEIAAMKKETGDLRMETAGLKSRLQRLEALLLKETSNDRNTTP